MPPFYEIRSNDVSVIHNKRQLAYPAHMHANVEILYVFSGVQCLEIEERAYEVREGEAAVIFSDIVHRYYKKGTDPADALLIIFNPRVLGGFFTDFAHFQPADPLLPRASIHPDAVYALEHLKMDDELTIKMGWIYIIMSHLLRGLELKQRQRIPVQDISKKIMEYLANHFTEPLTLDSLAAEFCVSKYYISHIFSSKIKMNFRNYLAILRAEYASKLILTTNDSLTAISSQAGFDSQRTFNRVFQSLYDMTPRDFRKNGRPG